MKTQKVPATVKFLISLTLLLGLALPLALVGKLKSSNTPPFFEDSEKVEAFTNLIKIKFQNATLYLAPHDEENLKWSCRGSRPKDISVRKIDLNSSLWHLPQGHCLVGYPRHLQIQIEGNSGEIFLEETSNISKVELQNGHLYYLDNNFVPLGGLIGEKVQIIFLKLEAVEKNHLKSQFLQSHFRDLIASQIK